MSTQRLTERVETIVVGGGQAGLSAGYHLAKRGLPFLILDANDRIGDSWRKRWDSLRLFTPARFDGLDGMPFPADSNAFPTKDEMGDYLESYAARFDLPVRTGVTVDSLTREDDSFVLTAGGRRFEAENVIVALSHYQKPKVPAFAGQLDPRITQFHSSEYRNPSQLREGDVLIVGAGNSGSEIGMELARSHRVWMAGRSTGEIPFRVAGLAGRLVLARLVVRFLFHRVLTVNTPVGRRVRPKVISRGGPLIRVKSKDMEAAGIRRVPRLAGMKGGRPVLDDGRVLDVANVVWCTGYDGGLSWIKLPVLGEHEPLHRRGIVSSQPGLYFVGLHFQYSLSSGMIHAVGRDARYIAKAVAERAKSKTRETRAVAAGMAA